MDFCVPYTSSDHLVTHASNGRSRNAVTVLHLLSQLEHPAMTQIQFKRADTADEMEQIHRLNHSIFAEEIGQHPKTEDGHLIDRFHDRNLYFVGCKDGEVIGMVSVHDGPEFSVASRLRDASQLAALRAPLEVRLLAIRPEF